MKTKFVPFTLALVLMSQTPGESKAFGVLSRLKAHVKSQFIAAKKRPSANKENFRSIASVMGSSDSMEAPEHVPYKDVRNKNCQSSENVVLSQDEMQFMVGNLGDLYDFYTQVTEFINSDKLADLQLFASGLPESLLDLNESHLEILRVAHIITSEDEAKIFLYATEAKKIYTLIEKIMQFKMLSAPITNAINGKDSILLMESRMDFVKNLRELYALLNDPNNARLKSLFNEISAEPYQYMNSRLNNWMRQVENNPSYNFLPKNFDQRIRYIIDQTKVSKNSALNRILKNQQDLLAAQNNLLSKEYLEKAEKLKKIVDDESTDSSVAFDTLFEQLEAEDKAAAYAKGMEQSATPSTEAEDNYRAFVINWTHSKARQWNYVETVLNQSPLEFDTGSILHDIFNDNIFEVIALIKDPKLMQQAVVDIAKHYAISKIEADKRLQKLIKIVRLMQESRDLISDLKSPQAQTIQNDAVNLLNELYPGDTLKNQLRQISRLAQ